MSVDLDAEHNAANLGSEISPKADTAAAEILFRIRINTHPSSFSRNCHLSSVMSNLANYLLPSSQGARHRSCDADEGNAYMWMSST